MENSRTIVVEKYTHSQNLLILPLQRALQTIPPILHTDKTDNLGTAKKLREINQRAKRLPKTEQENDIFALTLFMYVIIFLLVNALYHIIGER